VVKGEDTLVKRPITIPFDMVVHAIGMDPNVENPTIASTFGIELERHGYVGRGNAYGNTARRRARACSSPAAATVRDDRRLDRRRGTRRRWRRSEFPAADARDSLTAGTMFGRAHKASVRWSRIALTWT